ncbi:MAG: MATE family efflux transporter [candidate division WOR-3 bacterium]|nr:MATE family efflux transporter [candidate division WOR-3 bacterium]
MSEQTRLSSVDLSGRLGRAIWQIAWPVMIGQVLYTMLTVVDLFWVGRLGPATVAAVALGGSVLAVLYSAGQVFMVGVLATASRAAGADSRTGVRESLRHGLLLAVAGSIPPAVIGVLLSGSILGWFGAAPDVVFAGRGYLAILLAVLPGFFAGMVLYAGFQALGDTRTPMLVSLATNVVNFVLDPILIFGWLGLPRMGAAGAALATVLSQTGGLVAMAMILRGRGLLNLRGPVSRDACRTIIGIGAPAGLQNVTRPLTGMLTMGIVTRFGTEATAAFGIGLRLLQLMYIYLGGLGSAGQTVVGQSLGQHKPELATRASHLVLRIAFLLQLAVMPVLFLLAPVLVRVFNDNADVVRYGTQYLRVLTPMLIVVGLSTGWESAQRGAGDTTPPMIAALVSNWLIKIPVALLFARVFGLGVIGVWLGIGASIVIEAAILAVGYYRGRWLHKEVKWETARAE